MTKCQIKAVLILIIGILIAVFVIKIGESTSKIPYINVRGYTRKDGLKVSSYKRTLPGYRKKRDEHWSIFNLILIVDFFCTIYGVLYALSEQNHSLSKPDNKQIKTIPTPTLEEIEAYENRTYILKRFELLEKLLEDYRYNLNKPEAERKTIILNPILIDKNIKPREGKYVYHQDYGIGHITLVNNELIEVVFGNEIQQSFYYKKEMEEGKMAIIL